MSVPEPRVVTARRVDQRVPSCLLAVTGTRCGDRSETPGVAAPLSRGWWLGAARFTPGEVTDVGDDPAAGQCCLRQYALYVGASLPIIGVERSRATRENASSPPWFFESASATAFMPSSRVSSAVQTG